MSSAVFLAVAGVAAKLIGALHKLPLMGVLGAEGTGLYQLVFPMYAVVIAVASGGITQAVSRAAAREGGDGRTSLKAGIALTAVSGCAGSLFLALAGGMLARAQGNADAASAYLALAPAVAPACIAAALHGWWQGRRNMFPTAASRLVEQTVKLFVGLALAHALMPSGVEKAVAGAVLGVTAGELAAAASLAAGTVFAVRGKESRAPLRPMLRAVGTDALPGAFSSAVMPLLQLADSLLIVNILIGCGLEPSQATALYGVATAPVGAIASLPPVFTMAGASALLPLLCASEDDAERKRATGSALSAAVLAGGAGGALMYVFPSEILSVIYPSATGAAISAAADVLRLSAPGVLHLCLIQTITAVLQAKGRSFVPALVLLGAGAVRIALTVALVPHMGVAGSAAAMSAGYALALAADAFAARKELAGSLNAADVFKTAAAIAAGSGAGTLALGLLHGSGIFAAAVGSGVFALGALLVIVASDAFSVNAFLLRKLKEIKLFSSRSAKKSKKY